MQGKIRFQLQLHKFVWDPNRRRKAKPQIKL